MISTRITVCDGGSAVEAVDTEAVELLRVLRAARPILQSGRESRLVRIVNEAAGPGQANLVLAALDRLDEVTLGAYGTAIFDFEDRETTDSGQLLGIIDRAIIAIEASRDRRRSLRRRTASAPAA